MTHPAVLLTVVYSQQQGIKTVAIDFLPPSLTLGQNIQSTARTVYILISLLGLSTLSSVPENLSQLFRLTIPFLLLHAQGRPYSSLPIPEEDLQEILRGTFCKGI